MQFPKTFLLSLFFLRSLPAFGVDPSTPLSETPSSAEENKEFMVHLKDPIFNHGVIQTDQGGVIEAKDLRIQAQKIEYTNRIENGNPVQKVVAEGDLLVEFADRAFVGKRLEYDLLSRTGTLTDGKTYSGLWFLGGEKIELKEDGSYFIYNAYITTCESQANTWDIHANAVKITKDHLLSAKNVHFRLIKLPIFWLPSFKSNLKLFNDSAIRYKVLWDKGIGPRATMRYRVYSWQNFELFFRLDYRIDRGFGGAIESEYFSDDGKTLFLTKNYGAHDKSVPDETTNKRYRFQGLYQFESKDNKTHIHAQYDKISDDKMPSDFKNEDFEVNTQKITRLYVDHHRDSTFATLRFQPRINRFQSLNQELPLVKAGIRPFKLGPTGIISENYATAGYLDYVYATDLHRLSSTHAARLETRNQLYRPIPIGPITLTPNIGFIGIYYNNNPSRHAIGQAVGTYGGEANTRFYRTYNQTKHIMEPYLVYQGLTTPKAPLDHHFTFSIDDGYFRLNTLRIGVRNSLFSLKRVSFLPPFYADLYSYAFFADNTFQKVFPKAYLNLGLYRPSFATYAGIAWNFEEHLLDYFNMRAEWTVNQNLAMTAEFRHRSKFDWRKADHENFIVDVARQIRALLHSPLSDGRNTLLAKLFARIMPGLTMQIEAHYGWGRRNEPNYTEAYVEVIKLLTCNWRLKVAYRYLPNDPYQVSFNVLLK